MRLTLQQHAQLSHYPKTDPGLKFVDVFPLLLNDKGGPRPELYMEDRLHMSPAGYTIWVQAIASILLAKNLA